MLVLVLRAGHICHGPDSDARDVKVVIMNRVCLCLNALRALRGTTESATVINPSPSGTEKHAAFYSHL